MDKRIGRKGKTKHVKQWSVCRLGLLINETRKDTQKKRLPPDKIQCFLDSAISESWYMAWRDWILYGNKSSNNKVDEAKLPLPSTTASLMNSGNKPDCFQPNSPDVERILELIDPENIGVSETKLRDEIEREAKEQGRTLCPDWWENLQTEIGK